MLCPKNFNYLCRYESYNAETFLTVQQDNMEEMTEVKCSVIVPVYKAERLIRRCMNSLLSQTFRGFEILLVDDGSPDRSGEICDEYARKDSRVRVFHKQNGGVSSARQFGLDRARGEYVIHADPDDWIEGEMLEELYAKAKAEDADMVICGFYTERRRKTIYESQCPPDLTPDGVLSQLLLQKMHGASWNKLVRRSLFEKYQVSYPKEIICWEDLYVNCELLRHHIRLAYVAKAYYHYDRSSNKESITHTRDLPRLRSQMLFCDHFSEVLSGAHVKSLIESKRITKELAFRMKAIKGKDFINLYRETNSCYCNRPLLYQILFAQRIKTGVRLANHGHYRLGRFLFRALKYVK